MEDIGYYPHEDNPRSRILHAGCELKSVSSQVWREFRISEVVTFASFRNVSYLSRGVF